MAEAREVSPDESQRSVVTREYRLVVEAAAHIADLLDENIPEVICGSLANGAARVTSIGPVPADARPWHARLAGMPIGDGVVICVVPCGGNRAVILVHEERRYQYVTALVHEHSFRDPETGAPRLPREWVYGTDFPYECKPHTTVDRSQEVARMQALLSLVARATGADH